MAKRKQPKTREIPRNGKLPHGIDAPKSILELPFKWSSVHADMRGRWGWSGVGQSVILKTILPELQRLETSTWGAVQSIKHNHDTDVSQVIDGARQRLLDSGRETIDSLFQLKIGQKERLWGIKDVGIFYLLWWDPNHEIYRSR